MTVLFIAILLGVTLLFSGCLSKAPAVPPPPDGSTSGNGSTPPDEPPPSHTGWITQEENDGSRYEHNAYKPFHAVRREGAIVPGLKQGLVPQAVAYLPEMDWFLIAGYKLDPATDLIANPAGRRRTKQGALVPDIALSVPEKVQEISVIGDYVVLSQSYGRNSVSTIKVYNNPLRDAAHTADPEYAVPVWFLDRTNMVTEWTVPSMLEGFTVRSGEAYLIFESAAERYLSGSKLYPLSRLQIVELTTLLAGP